MEVGVPMLDGILEVACLELELRQKRPGVIVGLCQLWPIPRPGSHARRRLPTYGMGGSGARCPGCVIDAKGDGVHDGVLSPVAVPLPVDDSVSFVSPSDWPRLFGDTIAARYVPSPGSDTNC
jgi:hypothetical protein